MSRSYKKHHALSEMNEHGMKRMANRKVRRTLKNPHLSLRGNDYRRLFCSWMVRDYREVAPSKEVFLERSKERAQRFRFYKLKTDDEYLNDYYKWYVRK